jgi:hypothetical protein
MTHLTSIRIGSKSSTIKPDLFAAMARMLITSALMSGPALKAYRVRIRGIWFDVEDSQTLRPDGGSNPTGNAILWYNLTEFGFHIRCFTPQYES